MYTYLLYWVARSRAHTDRVEYYPMMDSVCVCVCVCFVCVCVCVCLCVCMCGETNEVTSKKGMDA